MNGTRMIALQFAAHVQNCDKSFYFKKEKRKRIDLENCLEYYMIFKVLYNIYRIL